MAIVISDRWASIGLDPDPKLLRRGAHFSDKPMDHINHVNIYCKSNQCVFFKLSDRDKLAKFCCDFYLHSVRKWITGLGIQPVQVFIKYHYGQHKRPLDKHHGSWMGVLMTAVNLGAVSIRKTVLPGMAIPMLKIRRPNGRLIFNMEIAICR